jgi:hypothetical protein
LKIVDINSFHIPSTIFNVEESKVELSGQRESMTDDTALSDEAFVTPPQLFAVTRLDRPERFTGFPRRFRNDMLSRDVLHPAIPHFRAEPPGSRIICNNDGMSLWDKYSESGLRLHRLHTAPRKEVQ